MIDARTAQRQTKSQGRISECMRILEVAISGAIDEGKYECTVLVPGAEFSPVVETVVAIMKDRYGYEVSVPIQKITHQRENEFGKVVTCTDFNFHISWK